MNATKLSALLNIVDSPLVCLLLEMTHHKPLISIWDLRSLGVLKENELIIMKLEGK